MFVLSGPSQFPAIVCALCPPLSLQFEVTSYVVFGSIGQHFIEDMLPPNWSKGKVYRMEARQSRVNEARIDCCFEVLVIR